MVFKDKVVLITGGTGSLGKVLTRRLLSGKNGTPERIIVFSRDEAKQHFMRLEYQQKTNSTEEVIYKNFQQKLQFQIGDVRDLNCVKNALRGVDIVINGAALKQVPSCEYFPIEATMTNILGAENIVRAISQGNLPIETVVGVSTDKACKPVNVMGMTKALQERIFIAANISVPKTRFICVRYGNVLASRGSVIPLFHEQIRNGGPVTLTTPDMTRFLLPLERAVDTICEALHMGKRGETFVPRIPSAKMPLIIENLLKDWPNGKNIKTVVTGIRPGEKVHEIMVSDEEAWRTVRRGDFFAIQPMLPELGSDLSQADVLPKEYSSGDEPLDAQGTYDLLKKYNLLIQQHMEVDGEFLR